MSRPVIALLTDFGNRDHYAGTMKGVVLGICPETTLVDISHEVPAGDVLAAALELAAAYRYFPAGSIFLVVVDPGVGSSRRGLAAEAGDYSFVAPDNGVLSIVFDENAPTRVVELSEPRYARPTVIGPAKQFGIHDSGGTVHPQGTIAAHRVGPRSPSVQPVRVIRPDGNPSKHAAEHTRPTGLEELSPLAAALQQQDRYLLRLWSPHAEPHPAVREHRSTPGEAPQAP